MSDPKKGWVSGRTRESADGLNRRPRTPEQERQLREAANRARQSQQKGKSSGRGR